MDSQASCFLSDALHLFYFSMFEHSTPHPPPDGSACNLTSAVFDAEDFEC